MVSEPCGRGAGVLSLQRDAPVTASGCKQYTLPQHRGCTRKDAVNQGGTTEVSKPPSLCSAWLAGTEAFLMLPFKAGADCAAPPLNNFLQR